MAKNGYFSFMAKLKYSVILYICKIYMVSIGVALELLRDTLDKLKEVSMKAFISVLLMVGAPLFVAHAQLADETFDLDLDPVVSEELSGDKTSNLTEKSPSIQSDAKQNRSIYIVNQASSGAKSDAKSKTEQNDTSILGSRAEELKKNRVRAEVETEMKASEKIEESRLTDERRRSEELFGDRLNKAETTVQQVAPIVVQPAPAPVAPVGIGRDELREDLKSILNEKEELAKEKPKSASYFIGMMGMTEFPKADNIQGSGVFGIGLGVEAKERILVEGMFQYASYQSNYIWLKSIEEYSGSVAVKMQFSKGSIRPLAGALAVYSYRTYTDTYQQYQYNYGGSQQSKVNALDVGLLGGAQFAITDDFSLGTEFRYLWNLTSKSDGYYPTYFPNSEPLDSLSHYAFVITGRFNF